MSYGKNKQTYNNKQWEKYLGTKSISSDLLYNLHLVQFIPPQRKSLGTTPYPHPCPDLQFRFLSLSKMSTEKTMAPHSSTPAWQIPWTEDPGRLQSMGSLGVGHDWATSLSLFTFHFHILEKGMATHSSVLAWRIPGMGEPGGLPSMGSHRFGHDWSDLAEQKMPIMAPAMGSHPPIQYAHCHQFDHDVSMATCKHQIKASVWY